MASDPDGGSRIPPRVGQRPSPLIVLAANLFLSLAPYEPLASVGGDLTVETADTGTYDVSGADVARRTHAASSEQPAE
jgi:hypothetical protein